MLLEYFIFGMVINFLMTGARCELIEVLAEAGSQAVLPCKCKPSTRYSPNIIWVKANQGTVWRKQSSGLQYWGASWSHKANQRVSCPHSQFERGDYNLQIHDVREEDAGIYSCRMESLKQITENVVMLRIIKVSISPPVPLSEDNFSISCNVSPPPYRVSVQWMLNNSTFGQHTEITSVSDSTKSVVRQKATQRLVGNWTCVVGYKGKVGRASATLFVKGIIQPSRDNTKVYASVGSTVTLPCVFSPGLIPLRPVWEKLKPGSLFKPSPSHLPASFSPSSSSSKPTLDKSATLKEVWFEDEGIYRCSATVKGQRLTRNMQLVVAKIVSSIPSKKKGSVTLTCQLTDTSELTDYEWVHIVNDHNGIQSVRSIQKGKDLTISKVSEENQGEWACRFYGREGILGNVTHHIQLMSGLSGQKSSGLSQNTGAVVGLSFLLLLLLLVLIKMYKNHQRRKKIFQYPAMETIVHANSNEREERERNREKK